jgi:hypothetical protein
VRVGEARERAPPLLGLPVSGWGGDLGSAVLGTGVGCEGGVFLSASICPRPHQLRVLRPELEIALLGVTT